MNTAEDNTMQSLSNLSDSKLKYFEELKKKSSKQKHQTLFLYLLILDTPAANAALKHCQTLDRLMEIHIHPNGDIGVMGIQDGLVKYRVCKPI